MSNMFKLKEVVMAYEEFEKIESTLKESEERARVALEKRDQLAAFLQTMNSEMIDMSGVPTDFYDVKKYDYSLQTSMNVGKPRLIVFPKKEKK
jgi:phosphoribosylformylglycinamidine (FGAM) synthase-like enzyme